MYRKEKERTDLNVPARFAEIWNMLFAILLVNTFSNIFQIIVNASVYSSPLFVSYFEKMLTFPLLKREVFKCYITMMP